MEVRFTKGKAGRTCAWVALRPPRTRVPGSVMAAGGDLPHDLSTFVIEDALAIGDGFWGCVAAGATFRSLGRRRTPQGVDVIRDHRAGLDRAEVMVNAVHAAWRRGEPTPCDAELARTLDEWRALPEGAELVRQWRQPVPNASAKRRRSIARL